ncbi:MAG: hypothetical protein MJY43_03000 [Bacteroidales bacterium]|nr:hypothetical protein [Bacteroidales bacterium]
METKDRILKFTENKTLNSVITRGILPVAAIVLVVVIIACILKPVKFGKETAAREKVAIERLKDIRTLQDAYKSTNGKYAESMDSLIYFYENGEIIVKLQIGSKDDSLTYAHTQAVKKALGYRGMILRGEQLNRYLYGLYLEGDKNLAFTIDQKYAVRDTIFNNRENFNVNDLRYIPFSDGAEVEMEAVIKQVSGVNVPLFEARMPYRQLLKGMDNQLRINLDADCRAKNRYEGLQVGSVSAPNNNAGNWE